MAWSSTFERLLVKMDLEYTSTRTGLLIQYTACPQMSKTLITRTPFTIEDTAVKYGSFCMRNDKVILQFLYIHFL